MKISNAYAQEFPEYRDVPKAVFAAVAFSLAMRMNEDNTDKAKAEFFREWGALHAAGILQQKPVKEVRP